MNTRNDIKIGVASSLSLNALNFDFTGKGMPVYKEAIRGLPLFPMGSMLINSLLARGYKVAAFVTLPKIEKPFIIKDNNLEICIARFGQHPGRNLSKVERNDLLFLMKQCPVDIIHAFWSYEYAWAAINSGIPTVIGLQDHATTILKHELDLFRLSRWLMNYIVLRKSKHLVANSQYLYNLLSERDKAKSIIISNFYSKSFDNAFNASNNRGAYIVSVCNGFSKRKNVANALIAFSLLHKLRPDLKYHLIGKEMQEGGPAYQFAETHNLLEGVMFMGEQTYARVIQEISQAKVFFHPSKEESFGMVLIEAMLVGTPVLGGQHSGNVPYLINHGKTGMLCNVEAPSEMANALHMMLDDENLLDKVRIDAYHYVKENFSETKIVDQWINLYHKVLDSSRK